MSVAVIAAGCAAHRPEPGGGDANRLVFRRFEEVVPANDPRPVGGRDCPIRATERTTGATLLLRRSFTRDSVPLDKVNAFHRTGALGDYDVLTPADRLGLKPNEWIRLDCRLMQSVAVVQREASLKQPRPKQYGPLDRADSLALIVAIYEMAVTNGIRVAHADTRPEVVCIAGAKTSADPPAEVMEALKPRPDIIFRPRSACRIEPVEPPQSSRSLVVDNITGRRGIVVTAEQPRMAPDGSFVVVMTYYEHGLSSAVFACQGGRRDDGRWEVSLCRMPVIS